MTTSVYWIRCADHTDMTSQGYIGVSGRFDRRMWEHYNLEGNRHLKFAIKKYGWDNLVKTQILIADEDYCLDIERKLRPTDDIGWNCTTGCGKPPINRWNLGTKGLCGAWNKGKKSSLETRKKISDSVKLQMQNPRRLEMNRKARLGMPSPMKGKKHSPETLKKMSEVKLGKKPSQETIDKRTAKLRGRTAPKLTCPHCEAIGGTGAMRRWHFDNCKNKENLNWH